MVSEMTVGGKGKYGGEQIGKELLESWEGERYHLLLLSQYAEVFTIVMKRFLQQF